MFTDIVGSTALFSTVSPQAAGRLRARHFQLYDGILAATGGRLVKNLGDGAMAVFGGCSHAVAAAELLQQRVLADAAFDRRIEVRIGLSTGEVTKEGDDYFGDPVVEAARLCRLADPGQILITSKVRLIAGRHATQRFEQLGPLALKGLPEAVEVEAVLWEPAPALTVPPPPRLRHHGSFFGRVGELAMLDGALKHATVEGPRLALVTGEAGIGKTTLATEFGLAAHAQGAIVLLGRCDERLRAPYAPFEEALAHYVAHAPEPVLADHVRSHGPDLGRLAGELGRRVQNLPPVISKDPDSERQALFGAVTALLSTTSVVQPTVLLLDNLQWADEDTLYLLRHVATASETQQLLIVCMYRAGELSTSLPLAGVLGSLTRELDPLRISLGGWADSDIVSLLQHTSEEPLDEAWRDMARLLTRETGGNPLFVNQMLHHLSDSGVVRQEVDGRWHVVGSVFTQSLPASVHDVITERIRCLGKIGRTVLESATVIGVDFDLDLLGQVTGIAEEELLDILDSAAAASLIDETPTSLVSPAGASMSASFSFHQAIVRRAFLESLRPSRATLIHRRVGEALEAQAARGRAVPAADLAYHFAAAGPDYGAKALRYAVAAAEEASRRFAFQEAVTHFEAALALCTGSADRDPTGEADLLIALGVSQQQAGHGEYRSTLRQAARLAIELDDGSRLVRATLADSRGFTSVTGAIDSELVALLETALGRCPADSPDRALVLAALCSELQYDPDIDRRRALAREAESLCSVLGDDRLAVTVANRMFTSIQTSYTLAELLHKTESTLRAAERLGDPVQLYWAELWRIYALRSAGSEREARLQLAQTSTRAAEMGQPLLIWWSTNVAAVGALLAGDPTEAERLASEVRELASQSGQTDADPLYQAVRICAAWERGDLAQLGPYVDTALTDRPDDEALMMVRTLAYAEADDLSGCQQMLRGLSSRIEYLSFASTLPLALTIYAEAAIRTRDNQSAAAIAERLLPWSDQVAHTGVTTTGPVSHYLGGLCSVLGRTDEAVELYERATTICEGMQARFFAARTALDWGAMLLEHADGPDGARARSLLHQARDVAASAGYAVVERRASSLLAGLTGAG